MNLIKLNEKYFRPNTKHKQEMVNFFLSQGGLGDYINFMPAFEWLANECHQIKGRIFVNEPFYSVAKFIMKPYKHWSVHKKVFSKGLLKKGDKYIDPQEFDNFINATGSHLLDLGFILYCTQTTAFDGYDRLPRIKYNGEWKWPELDQNSKYAVFTPGYTAAVRAMPDYAFNELVKYVYSKGITPVFLGQKNFTEDFQGSYYARFNPNYDYSLGIDLREKTTLLEAIQIMSKARFVIGVDNGLLHFAGTTDVPIIFGHTVAEVKHRKIRRPNDLTIDISISRRSLPCIGCQSNMRFIFGHRFRYCIYEGKEADKEIKCVNLLFAKNCETWKKAIDYILERRING